MTLSQWVSANGGPKKTARILSVHAPRVYNWIDGSSLPRPVIMQKIVRASGGKLTYDMMINSYRAHAAMKDKKRALRKSKPSKKSVTVKAAS